MIIEVIMKETLSIIDSEVKSIKHQHLRSFFAWSFAFFLLAFIINFFYLSAYYLEVPYKDFFLSKLSVLYLPSSQWSANILFISLSALVCLLAQGITLLIVKRQYKDRYNSLIQNEIELSGFKFIKLRNYYEEIRFENVYNSMNLLKVENEYLFTLSNEFNVSFYQLHSKEEGGRYSLLMKMDFDKKFNHFLQIRTSGRPKEDTFNGENLFMYSYPSSKFKKDFRVFSSYGKKTSEFFNSDFLKFLNEITLYAKNDYIISCYENEIYILFSGWRLDMTEDLFKNVISNGVALKIEAVTSLYNYFEVLYNKFSNVNV
jgi:hypothetical protein